MEQITTLMAQGSIFLNAIFDLGEELLGANIAQSHAGGTLINMVGVGDLLMGFLMNLFFVGIVVRCFYYPKCKRSEFFFTFILIAISIFLLIYLLGGIKLKTGFALGLFAIFSIIRYRTEQVAIREMTYLFIIIAMSAINGLVMEELSYSEMITANLLFIFSIWLCESRLFIRHLSYKIIKYDNIKLITPDKEQELIEDLKKRTGLDIVSVEVGSIDFLKDASLVKIYYRSQNNTSNTVDTILKSPTDEYKLKN